MHPALVFQAFENVRPGDTENDFPIPAQIGGTRIHRLHLPTLRIRVARIHPIQIRREQRRFRSTRASANFNNRIPRIARVRRNNPELQLHFEALLVGLQPRDFLLGHLGQIRVIALKQLSVLLKVAERFEIALAKGDQVFEPRILARQFLRALVVLKYLRIVQRRFHFGKASLELLDMWS
jgi:hypothetical protein